jgi:electron transfer flavoprotein-quinone oxidoreductase
MASGVAAAQTVIKAKKDGDFTAKALAHYEGLLRSRFVLKELDTFKRAPEFLENSRIYDTYPDLLCSAAMKMFENDGTPREGSFKTLMGSMKGKITLWQLMKDAWQAKESL